MDEQVITTNGLEEGPLELLRKAMKQPLERNTREVFLELNPHLREEEMFRDRYEVRKEAAVLIPIIERSEPTVLLTVRSSDMPSHAGQVSFPGGRVHADDRDYEHTALRETHEEVGILPENVRILGDVGVHVGGQGYNVMPYVGLIPENTVFQACPREVDEIFEVPLKFLLDIKNHGTEDKSWRDVSYKMFTVPYEGYYIWGLTAGILRTLAERVELLQVEEQ